MLILKKLIVFIVVLLLSTGVIFAGSQQVSSTIASTFITNARALFNEASTDINGVLNDAEMLVWLNDGMVDIAAQSHCLEATEAVTLTNSVIEYAITTTYIVIEAVTYTNADGDVKGLVKTNIRSLGEGLLLTEPNYWYEFAGKVGIYPALSAKTTEAATAYLITRPTAITSTGAVTTPAVYDKALTYYITAHTLLKDKQVAAANNFFTLYQAEIDRYRIDFNEQIREKEAIIR